LRKGIAAAFAERTQDEWTAVFAASDACVAPVLSLREAAEHPHLKARGSVVELNGILQPAPAPRFSRTPTELGTPPPMPGQDTEEVLATWGVGAAPVLTGVPGAEDLGFAPVEVTGELTARRAAVAELGAVLRSLIDLATCTEVDTEVIQESARRLLEVAPALRVRTRRLAEPASVDDLVGGVRMFSPVIGAGNPISPPLRVEIGEGEAVGWCTLGQAYEGPHMYVHGGVSAMLLDQVLGHAAAVIGHLGVTKELSIRYRRPAPLNVRLRVWARVEQVEGRHASVVGGITTADEPDVVLVEANAGFVRLRPDQADALFVGRERSSGR
jgi:acyl-coenzyme A thioesterase PaaI-like protein